MRASHSRWTFYGTCIATSVAFAGPPPQSCTTIADDIHRLACYDSAFKYSPPAPAAGSSGTAAPPASPPVPTAAAAHAAANSAVASPAVLERTDDFGLSQQAQRDRAGVVAVESISAGVTRVDRNAADRLVVTLDNGQVWQQSETSSQVRVRPGDTVTIKRAALGSFMLVTAKNGSTRAKRIK